VRRARAADRRTAAAVRALRVDPIACDGRGLCAELIPERITLDEWGYPIVDPAPLTPSLQRHAERAVAACPMLALRLGWIDSTEGRAGSRSRRR